MRLLFNAIPSDPAAIKSVGNAPGGRVIAQTEGRREQSMADALMSKFSDIGCLTAAHLTHTESPFGSSASDRADAGATSWLPESTFTKRSVAAKLFAIALVATCGNSYGQAASPEPVFTAKIERDKHWIVDGTGVDGKPRRFLLDTGASISVLDRNEPGFVWPLSQNQRQRMTRAGWIDHDASQATATQAVALVSIPSNNRQMLIGSTPPLKIQQWSIPAELPALVEDVKGVAASSGDEFDGIIGMTSLQDLTLRADYKNGQLTAYAGASPDHEWHQCVYMTLDSNRTPFINFSSNNMHGTAVIDSGGSGDFSLKKETFSRMVDERMFSFVGERLTIDASQSHAVVREGMLKGMTLGTYKMPALSVTDNVNPDVGATVGVGVLSKMDMVELDFKRHRLCFDAADKPVNSMPSRVGAWIVSSSAGFEVKALLPSGRLARSAVRVGDVIVAIGEHSTQGMRRTRADDLLIESSTNSITLQRQGKTIKVKLAKLAKQDWQ